MLESPLAMGLKPIVHVSEDVRAWLQGVERKDGNATIPLNDAASARCGNMSFGTLCKRITDEVGYWEGIDVQYVEEAERAEKALGGIDKNLENKNRLQYVD
ncbi:hypothetical protein, conserved [Babesia ovata]|uniref:Uncharacterized protein n=1 Tax=Babesia ovata TaxID=189622 RepID=A0A2H6KFM1_9APIC|nr:uncharacterized protein BOVATA_032790 [Babesia ovata]GBE61786.1 hypothetical protein, conserved [Babesia ovata]